MKKFEGMRPRNEHTQYHSSCGPTQHGKEIKLTYGLVLLGAASAPTNIEPAAIAEPFSRAYFVEQQLK
jgi:hypothetical protein